MYVPTTRLNLMIRYFMLCMVNDRSSSYLIHNETNADLRDEILSGRNLTSRFKSYNLMYTIDTYRHAIDTNRHANDTYRHTIDTFRHTIDTFRHTIDTNKHTIDTKIC